MNQRNIPKLVGTSVTGIYGTYKLFSSVDGTLFLQWVHNESLHISEEEQFNRLKRQVPDIKRQYLLSGELKAYIQGSIELGGVIRSCIYRFVDSETIEFRFDDLESGTDTTYTTSYKSLV